MKVSYLATVAILYSFGYCTCNPCKKNQPGYIHVRRDTPMLYSIVASTSTELLYYPGVEAVRPIEVRDCLETLAAVKLAVEEWKDHGFLSEVIVRYRVKSTIMYRAFIRAIMEAIADPNNG